jgi:hypothetical protein
VAPYFVVHDGDAGGFGHEFLHHHECGAVGFVSMSRGLVVRVG